MGQDRLGAVRADDRSEELVRTDEEGTAAFRIGDRAIPGYRVAVRAAAEQVGSADVVTEALRGGRLAERIGTAVRIVAVDVLVAVVVHAVVVDLLRWSRPRRTRLQCITQGSEQTHDHQKLRALHRLLLFSSLPRKHLYRAPKRGQ